MTKYYRVIKDHPLWEVGALLSNTTNPSYYQPLDDLHVKSLSGVEGEKWHEGAALVENQPEWFERVYKVSVLKQTKYLAKEAARKAHDELYK